MTGRYAPSRREFMRDALTLGGTFVLAGACDTRSESLPITTTAGGQPVAGDATAIHQSTIVVNGLDPSDLRVEYLDKLVAGGVSCWHRGGGNLAGFSRTLQFCDEHSSRILSAGSVGDIRRAFEERKIAHLSGWQSASPLITDGGDRGPALGNLRGYHELGLRICGIAYNTENAFGGGCLVPEVGLSELGRRLVEEVHKLRIVLDVGGHTGEQTSFDALAMSAGVPVVCTHTNVRALNDNPRCNTDRFFEAIAGTGGVIGLTAFNDFHARTRHDTNVARTPQVGLERHLDQYDYLKKLVGVDHIGIGPDFIDGPGRNDVGTPNQSSQPAEIYSQRPWYYVRGFEDISQLPNVTTGLLARGWSVEEVRKVLGENWLRVYEQVWGP